MIITSDDDALKRPSDAKMPPLDGPQEGPDEPPPSYFPNTDSANSVVSGSTLSDSSPPFLRDTFKTKPTNFLALFNEYSALRGEFVIDPSIVIPSAMLPPLDDGETETDRKNLSLRSRFGSLQADIWLLRPQAERPTTGAHKPRQTTIGLTSEHGSIHARVRTRDGAGPFSLAARANHGAVHLALPRAFQGLLTLSTRHGSISVSNALAQNATQLSQVGNARRYFVGDFGMLGEGKWEGDQVEVEAVHGAVRVRYVDEVVDAQGKKGLFGWLFKK